MALPEVKQPDLATIKQMIWRQVNGNLQTITMAAASIGLVLPIENEQDAEAVLKEINRRKNNPIPAGIQDRRVVPIQPPKFERVVDDPGDSFLKDQTVIDGL